MKVKSSEVGWPPLLAESSINECAETKGGSLACYFGEKQILKLFPLSSCQYVSTIPGKKLHVSDLSKIDIL